MGQPGGLPSPSSSASIGGAKRMLPMNRNRLQSDGPALTPSYSSATGGSLKQAINTLTFAELGVWAHVCNDCKPPKTFTTAEHLSRHQASHEEPKFPCHGCDRTFHREELLLRHLGMNEHDHEKHQPTPTGAGQTRHLPTPASSVAPPPSIIDEPRPAKKSSSRSTGDKLADDTWKLAVSKRNTLMGQESSVKKLQAAEKGQHNSSSLLTRKVVSGRAKYQEPPKTPVPARTPVRNRNFHTIRGLFEDDSGAETGCSDEDNIEDLDVDIFKSKFAENLASQVLTLGIDLETEDAILEQMFDSLPKLLAAFALKLGHKGSTQTHRDAMYLVYKFRHDISTRFRASIKDSVDNSAARPLTQRGANSEPTSSRIRDWLDTGVEESIAIQLMAESSSRSPEETLGKSQPGVDTLPDNSKYATVFDSAAYKWLLSSIGQTIFRSPSSPLDAINDIRSKIRGHYRQGRSQKINRHQPSKGYKIYLLADLDLVAFLNEQYTDRPSPKSRAELLSSAITLTGHEVDAQALPCVEYIQQTWPITGLYVMNAICSALDNQASATEELPDGSDVTANLIQHPVQQHLGIRIKAKGTVDFLGEVGEIFGWLTAALRASPDKDELAWCEPYLNYSGKGSDAVSDMWEMRFKITKSRQGMLEDKLGQCWHGMFRNAVIAKGFPIPRRTLRNTGLEVPLHMAAGLMDTPKLHEFMGHYCLKGFATMLAPVELTDGVVFWHFHYNPTGRRISYCDALNNGSKDRISLEELHSSRHIIGWCSEAFCMAGDKDANYDVRSSALPFPGREFALEKVSISLGNIITGGCQFSIGKKDIPLHITKQGYVNKLRWIDQKYLIFWDEEDKRGWLVRGSSVLLHLVRASLEHCRSDRFSSEFLFDFDAFREPRKRFRHDSALDALLNKENRNLSLYREDKTQEKTIISNGRWTKQIETTATFTTLEDKIVELYESLEKLIDAQAHSVASSKGINAKPSGSGRLKGWDLKDIAMSRDPLYLRVASLPEYGKTWTGFAKSIGAVTLFGCGFGDIIKPNFEHSDASPTESSMPAREGLLGACLADLKDIIDIHGKLDGLDRLFKSEEVDPKTFPHGGVMFGPHTKLKRSVRAVLPGPPQFVTKDSPASTSTTPYSQDASSTPPSLIGNRGLAGNPSDILDSDPVTQETLATTPGLCRTPSRSDFENLAPSVADEDAPPDDNGNQPDEDGDTTRIARPGLRSVKKLVKRPREDDNSQQEGNGKGVKRRKLRNLVSRTLQGPSS